MDHARELFSSYVHLPSAKVLDLRPKSVCAVEMTMYVHRTCINRNRKDNYA